MQRSVSSSSLSKLFKLKLGLPKNKCHSVSELGLFSFWLEESLCHRTEVKPARCWGVELYEMTAKQQNGVVLIDSVLTEGRERIPGTGGIDKVSSSQLPCQPHGHGRLTAMEGEPSLLLPLSGDLACAHYLVGRQRVCRLGACEGCQHWLCRLRGAQEAWGESAWLIYEAWKPLIC